VITPALDGTFPHLDGATLTCGHPGRLAAWVQERAGQPLAVDIETFGLGLDMLRLKCVTFATPDACMVADPRDPRGAMVIRMAMELAPVLIVHNAMADAPSLVRNGLMQFEHLSKVEDTLLYARLALPDDRGGKALDQCASRWLGMTAGKIQKQFQMLGWTVTEGYKRMDIDRPVYLMGAGADGIATGRLWPVLQRAAFERLTEHPFRDVALDREGALALMEREQVINRQWALPRTITGLRADFEFLDRYREENGAELHNAETLLRDHGIDPGNGNQIGAYLEQAGAIPPGYPRTEKTDQVSTKADDLATIRHPAAQTFVRAKQLRKVQDDYLVKVVDMADAEGRVHPSFGLLAAVTGRGSMADPPLHQFPAPARGIIGFDDGDDGCSIDWSQIEPVLSANLAGDLDAVRHYEAGGDFYQAVADHAGISRKKAKVVLLAQIYGEGLKKLSDDLGLDYGDWVTVQRGGRTIETWTYAEAKALKQAAMAPLPRVRQMIDHMKQVGRDTRMMWSVSGRIMPIPMGKFGVAAHKAVNYAHQGGAYDLMAEALKAACDAGLAPAVYLSMHDELVAHASAAHDLRAIMQRVPPRLELVTRRKPVLRTDVALLGGRWSSLCKHGFKDPCDECHRWMGEAA
jgi:DNA polymerase I-like protein with 3'-5' exonuclease and polymerase domains